MDDAAIKQWLESLDHMSYYALFGVAPDAPADTVRYAFHRFAEVFHPDMHHWRSPAERTALGTIFRRGTEAYRVLSEPGLRARYDDALAQGDLRPDALVLDMDRPRGIAQMPSLAPAALDGGMGGGRRSSGSFAVAVPLIDTVRRPSARPFALRAVELAKQGDPKQAKLQLVMAMHMDPENSALEAFAKEVDALIAAKSAEDKNAGKK